MNFKQVFQTASDMIVPLFKVSNMAEAIRHYTEVLDFETTDPNDHAGSPVVKEWIVATIELA